MVWIFPVKLSKFRNASNAVDQIFRKFPVRNCQTGVHLARLSSFPLTRSRKCYSIRHKKFRKFKPEIFHRIGTPVIQAIPVTLEISGKLDSWRPGGLGALDSGLNGSGIEPSLVADNNIKKRRMVLWNKEFKISRFFTFFSLHLVQRRNDWTSDS